MASEQAISSALPGGEGGTRCEVPEPGQAEELGDLDRIAFFDLETEAWDKFVCGGVIDEFGTYKEYDTEESCWQALLSIDHRVEVYAWNGGRFDFLWCLEQAREAGIECQISVAGRVTRFKVKGGPTFKDACALVPLSLEKAATIAAFPLTKDTGLVCSCAKPCGGYCRIRRVGMTRDERAALSKYLRLDCEAGIAIVRAVRAEADRSGYVLRNTIGGTAYATAKAVCGFDDAEWTPDSYQLARSGYFGGRVEVYQPSVPEAHSCDLISAYPWALGATPLPVGDRIVISGARAERAFARGREGIYGVDVLVPEMFVPPLPCRTGARVVFPIGLVSGAWTRIELAAALAEGCTVRRWSRAIVWEGAEAVCKPFVDQAFGRRALAIQEGNPGLKEWHKLVANSFTGKCAQQPDMERVLLNPSQVKLCPAGPCGFPNRALCERLKRSRKCCLHACEGGCGAFKPLDRKGKLWTSSFFRIPDCGHVHWSAYLTAATRIEWRRQALADGQGGATLVYGDTDSIFSTERRTRREAPPGGDELGAWKYEGAIQRWRCLAPKVYEYERADPHAPGGWKRVGKAKGLSGIDAEEWDSFSEGDSVTADRGVMSLKMAAKQDSLFTRKRITRTDRSDGLWFGGRKLGPDGRTYPATLAAFEGR